MTITILCAFFEKPTQLRVYGVRVEINSCNLDGKSKLEMMTSPVIVHLWQTNEVFRSETD